ncbi:MAG: type IV secretion system protein [Alphaproteobacteria bacterium]|nr:type IV secretion system protein [Alphaproteobacteria bacterium]
MTKKKISASSEYFEHGATWEHSIYASMSASKNRAWIIAFMSMGIALSAIFCLMLLLPLKTYEPYVITVDRSTGYVEMTRELAKGKLSEDDAVTESNLVKYVTLRESYNPHILKDNYQNIALMSDKKALKEFEELWSADNPANPSRQLGYKGTIDVQIKNVAFISDDIAQIRFLTEKREHDIITRSHWSSIIKFQYTQKPMKMIERFKNPLGFQVISYRKSQETL